MRDEEKQILSKGSKWQRMLRKKWVFPAIYLASAALILTAVLWFQNGRDNATIIPEEEQEQTKVSYRNEEAVPVNLTEESLLMPVENEDLVVIHKGFYDFDSTEEEQQAALVFYNNTYHQSTGIDLVTESGESFEVLASASGTVITAEKDALLGNVVEVKHDNGIVTMYQSLEDVRVEAGQEVEQGQAIGIAGSNVFNQDAGVHVHFEIRANGVAVNPVDYLGQPLSEIVADMENGTEEERVTEETDRNNIEDEEEAPIDDQEEQETPEEETNQGA
ncbi:M23 family metallopeptidase [Bacillus solimangrovi]|uniref:M23ase beta-sheet core domain-containing protein n=1 Tax=Bacillus solimangrovi TaxID=1305675 RepID=A0A1E5LGY3_9BACI|nr:M23 family metallopeptidase [Bacillus solimangrovi]OEH93332.1 hypothetical protein BFG57_12475 [Bacillus solimangrovi]